jgi:signal transduction histidine kinase
VSEPSAPSSSPPTDESSESAGSALARLAVGLGVAVLVIVGFSLYAAREIRTLRDEQAATSERNRLDTLQIVRIQQNLSSVAGALRDMLGGTEPYPLSAWANTFARLRIDLEQALARERELAPAGRLTAEQARLDEANGRFWEAVDRAFATANAGGGGAAAESAGAAIIRGDASARHAELVTLVSQLVIHNTRMDEASAARGRDVYDQVARQIYFLAAVLVAGVVIGGAILLRNTRRTFETVQGLAAERRALSWRMLTMQETLQTEFARELHDEFGQILTAVGMMLGRVRRKAAAAASGGEPGAAADSPMAPFVADLEEAQQVTQRALDRVRKKSRLLHPVILDDFGLQQAVAWYTDEFARQHGIDTRFEPDGDLSGLPPDVATHVYRIVQESLTNVAKHAEASQVLVRLIRDADGMELTVADDGKGPPPLNPARGPNDGPGGIGITSMRERAALMGGRFEAGRGPRGGLHVVVWVPLARPEPPAGPEPSAEPSSDPSSELGSELSSESRH